MNIILDVKNLKKHFPVKGGFFKRSIAKVKAVDGVSFSLEKGRTLGLVGESGCGKSTLGRTILRLSEPTSGDIIFQGESILQKNKAEMKPLRQKMQIIFQDPYASLNPRFTIYEMLREPLDAHRIGDPLARDQRIFELLEVVGLRRQVLNRYPHEFSGGQRQRIGIARALTVKPSFIVADEPVSALDVSVQAQVLNLISDLQKEFGISFLFIAHDLAVVQHISHDVGVMYLGHLVERASAASLYKKPMHPYTQALLSAIPRPEPKRKSTRSILKGDVPSPINPPPGCPFHTRCPQAMPVCQEVFPQPKTFKDDAGQDHLVSCHLY